MIYTDVGIKPYDQVLKLQEETRRKRVKGLVEDTVIFCEHEPVFTIGRRDSSADWISDLETIAGDGIAVVKTDRGGRITYHGPGQLVAYFIFNINELHLGVKVFVNRIEEVCLRTLKGFGIDALRDPEHPGLWVDNRKIVAIGFHIGEGVSMHGIALNIAPDLSHYKHIVPCGIVGRGVTSMKEILKRPVDSKDVITAMLGHIKNVFGFSSVVEKYS